jgi:hypothetical protein
MFGVKYVSESGNSKLSKDNKVDATYVSTLACPKSCALYTTCYAKLGPLGFVHVARLNKEAEGLTSLQISRAEAKLIDQSYNGGKVPDNRVLRLHVSGDTRTSGGARVINNAVKRWLARCNNGKVYSYTHCWDSVLREDWSEVSMLASVDRLEDVELARQNGYAPSIVVAEHAGNKAYKLTGVDLTLIPCPSQICGIKCTDCRLCMNADFLFEHKMGIAFAAHGIRKSEIKRRLNIIK